MKYIVFDLEWNQAAVKEREVRGIPFEILEIGAVKLDEDFNTEDNYSALIKPQVYKTMHIMTSKIVHFNLKDMQKERPFPYVMSDFLSWCGEDVVFCTWSPSDLVELQRNMDFYGTKPICHTPFKYYDVQKLFSIDREDGKLRRSLEYAVDFLDIKNTEDFHSALSDAHYTAQVLRQVATDELMKYYSYDTYHLPRGRDDEIYDIFPTYSKYISRSFKNRHAALRDKRVYHIKCNACNRHTRRVIKWFTTNNGRYYQAVSRCPVHGFLKAKLRMKKLEGERVYVVKTVKLQSEEQVEELRAKYKRAKDYQKSKSSNSDL